MRGAALQCSDFLRTTYVGRAAPPVEESWDSGEEEEERAVVAAGVVTHGLLALGFALCFPLFGG